MKIWHLIGIAVVASGCSVDSNVVVPGVVEFGGMRIPQEYILHAPGGSLGGVFDDEEKSIALVVQEREVKGVVSKYQIEQRGSREVSLVVNLNPANLSLSSNAVLSDFRPITAVTVPDQYLPHTRMYRSPENWILVADDDSKNKLVAQCRISGVKGEIEVCLFKKIIGGYGVSYHLQNSNIALDDSFVEFILLKFNQWQASVDSD